MQETSKSPEHNSQPALSFILQLYDGLGASKLSFKDRAPLIKLFISCFHFLGMCSCTFSTYTLLALHPAAAQQLSSSPVNHINLCCLGCIPVVVVVLLFWSMPRGGVLLSRYEGGGGVPFFYCSVDVGSSLAASFLIPKWLRLHMEANRE